MEWCQLLPRRGAQEAEALWIWIESSLEGTTVPRVSGEGNPSFRDAENMDTSLARESSSACTACSCCSGR
eukprot:2375510-Pyramimonas_sp.AAC.1